MRARFTGLIFLLLLAILMPVDGRAQSRPKRGKDVFPVDLKKPVKVKVRGDESPRDAAPAEPVDLDAPVINRPVRGGDESADIRWGGDINYQVRTDLADQQRPRQYTHSLGLSFGLQNIAGRFNLMGLVTLAWDSFGERRSEVPVDSDRAEFFVNDFALAVEKRWTLGDVATLGLIVANEFPTSPEAQREEYRSVSSAETSLSIPLIRERLFLRGGVGAHYIWNSFEYSPATGLINKQSGANARGGIAWSPWRGLSLDLSAGAQSSRFLDGTSDVAYRNAFGITYGWSRYAVSTGFMNGSYLDQDEANVWFVDEYRRMVNVRARVAF